MIGGGLCAVGDAERFGDALTERNAHVFGVGVLFANVSVGAAASAPHHSAIVMSPVRFAQPAANRASAAAAIMEAMRILAPFL